MTIDKIEIDYSQRGYLAKIRRNRSVKNPKSFETWEQALFYAATELQVLDQLKALLLPEEKEEPVKEVAASSTVEVEL